MEIKEAIKEIIKLEQFSIFNDHKKFMAILSDLGTSNNPQKSKELNVFKNAVDDKILKLCIDNNLENSQKIIKIKRQLDNKGISSDWIDLIIESFSFALNWKNNNTKEITSEKPIISQTISKEINKNIEKIEDKNLDQVMKNYQKILIDKTTNTENIINKYPDILSKYIYSLKSQEEKIKNITPEIMVYGIYNAGKSSILNELLGEDKAKVQDKPTTDRVDYYSFNGYKIADTPGIFAPIKHEEVTEEHLKKADIVLFVMSTTGSNERLENYERIKLIDKVGKKIIIVLNDKNGDLGENDEVINEIKAKVHKNMRQLGIENLNEKYQIITVNAEMAKCGRQENEPFLIEESNINELKQVIEIELKNTNSFKIWQNTISEIEKILYKIIEILYQNTKGISVERNKIQKLLKNINDVETELKENINTSIETNAISLKEELPSIILESYKDNSTEKRINKKLENFAKEISKNLKLEIIEKIKIINNKIESIKISINEAQSDNQNDEEIKEIKILLENLSNINNNLETNLDISNEKSNNLKGIIGGTLATAGAVEIGTALATGFGLEFGGIISAICGLSFEAVTPFIGPILAIGGAGLLAHNFLKQKEEKNRQIEEAVRKKNEELRQAREREENIKQEITQKCNNMVDNVEKLLKNKISQKIDKIISQYTNLFKQQFSSKKTAESQLNLDIQRIREIISEYRDIKTELGDKEVELA